jgi:metal-responsive CopG/Arc/MetJ family transcriptional regulator
MASLHRNKLKTSVILDRNLIKEIDQHNPFPTRKEFLDNACREYLGQLRRKHAYEQLAAACAASVDEDKEVNEDWEVTSLEHWE